MNGNVREWVSSLNEPYPYDATDGREEDTRDTFNTNTVIRGGSWRSSESVANRISTYPSGIFSDIGFRCARDADE
jgi:formylglycine-generating enzyme required for sulfatase activity